MCTTCLDGAQIAMRSVAQSFADMQVVMGQAYTNISVGVNEAQRVVNQIALKVFKAINDILKNTDPTKNALQLVMSGIDLCEMAGVPVAACRTMTSSLKTVTSFVSAKSIFQKLDTFASTQSPFAASVVSPAQVTKFIGTGAFAVSDGITFAKWCADNKLMSGRWFNRPVSVFGRDLPMSPTKIQTTATLVGFSSNILGICNQAWSHGGFTPESTLDLASNVSKIASIVASQTKTQAGLALSALANVVANTASIALFLMRRPVGCCGPRPAAVAVIPADASNGGSQNMPVVNASLLASVSQRVALAPSAS